MALGFGAFAGAAGPPRVSVATPPTKYPPAVKWGKTVVDTSKYKKAPPWTIGYINGPGALNAFGLTNITAAKWAIQHDKRIKKALQGFGNNDPKHGITVLEDMVAQKPDIIVIEPTNPAAFAAPISRATAAGIPVVICASGAPLNGSFVTFETTDLYQGGYMSALGLVKLLGGKGNVVLGNGYAGTDTTESWRKAALSVFKKYPGIKVIDEFFGQFSVAKSTSDFAALLSKHSQIDGVWAGGAEHAAGAIQALKQAGRKMPFFGVTNSDLNGFQRLAKENRVRFVGIANPASMWNQCIQLATKVLSGQKVPKFINVTPLVPKGQFYDSITGYHYVPQLSDDFDGPLNGIPVSFWKKNGFGRK
jgi:ABC-type sugar transport system substrate-binding protein